jgi:diguanylate cyclase (GGDEF)-like protein
MKTELDASPKLASKQLLQLSFWGGIATIVWILVMSLWFDAQARETWLNGRRFTANLMAEGISGAIQNNLVSRNYAEMEGHLKQAVSDSRVKSALVTDIKGKVLSHVVRDEATQETLVFYSTPSFTPPDQTRLLQEYGTTVVQWMRVDNGVPLGWLRLEILATKSDQALVDLRQRFIVVFGIASLILLGLLLIVTSRAHYLIRINESSILEKQAFLEGVAYRDSLTQLPNRHMLLERLGQDIARCNRQQEKLLVCFLDLDGFKNVNDAHGHDAGDEVLREVAQRLKRHVRENDTVARLGGDEFVLVMGGIDILDRCDAVLQRILDTICEPISVAQHKQVQVSASMGVTVYPDDNSVASILLEHADQAMYNSKRSGKNKSMLYEIERNRE